MFENAIVLALLWGGMIGLSATLLHFLVGQRAGISGIIEGVFREKPLFLNWQLAFTLGLVAGGLLLTLFLPDSFALLEGKSTTTLLAAGLLVGMGSRIGGGCTSGHGICGISRLSLDSIMGTITFLLVGVIVAVGIHLTAGAMS